MKELLDSHIPQLDRSNPYLFQSNRRGNLSEKRLDEIVKQLFERAGLKTQKILRWHCFKKLVLRTSAELGLNQWSAKILVGKSVPADIMTYISGLNLKEDFLKLSSVLKLKSDGNGNGKVSKLKELVLALEKENAQLKQRIEILQKNFESHEKVITDLNERLTYYEKHGKKKPAFEGFR